MAMTLFYWSLFLGVILTHVHAEEFPSYYDDLRTSGNVTVLKELKGENKGKIMHLVNDEDDVVRLCHIPIFFQYTTKVKKEEKKKDGDDKKKDGEDKKMKEDGINEEVEKGEKKNKRILTMCLIAKAKGGDHSKIVSRIAILPQQALF